MTIEERADKAMRQRSADYLQPLSYEFKNGYEQGATEQKAIDDANLEKIVSSWKEEEEYWIKRNKKLIKKACDYLYEWNKQQAIKYDARDILSVTEYTINVQDFRKAMEENSMDKAEEILKKMIEIADRMKTRHEEYEKHKDEIAKGDFSNYDVSK